MKCSRCKRIIKGAKDISTGTTAGYYDVSKPPWSKFATYGANEIVICDSCMWNDPGYIAAYGKIE